MTTLSSWTPDWVRIRQARGDLSDYLIHWTRAQLVKGESATGFDVLKCIASCGYLHATFAPRQSYSSGATNPTIRGSHPCVCFTEQPISDFLDSCATLPDRYQGYGVIVHKWPLYLYGGRPVIYGDERMLSTLDDEHKYLWNRFDPIPAKVSGSNYPVDWTHEREWRCRVYENDHGDFGTGPSEGVPLLLPPVTYPAAEKKVLALPRFVVRTVEERTDLRKLLKGLPKYDGENPILAQYFQHASQSRIIPLDLVSEHLGAGELQYGRLETLPYDVIDPDITIPTPEAYL